MLDGYPIQGVFHQRNYETQHGNG